jgi:hypothetical protein
LSISHVFSYSIDDISSYSGSILMQDSVVETLLVEDSTTKMTVQNFWNFIAKFGSKVQICWKLEELKWNFLNNSEVSSYFLGHILLFWKVTVHTIEKNTRLPVNYSFGKNICAELVNTGGAAGE